MAEETKQQTSQPQASSDQGAVASRPRTGKAPRKPRPSADMLPMDGSVLERPQHFMGVQWIVLAALVIVAAIIGFNVYNIFMDNVIYANERQQEAVNTQLARNVSLDLPDPSYVVGCDDETIVANMTILGHSFFLNDVADGTTLEIIKLPSDITAEQGQTLYSQGINKLSASEAAKLLNGMWRLDVSRGDGTVNVLRFADFKSGSAEAALTAAMAAQGLTEDSVTDSGTDDSGNTYKTGSVVVNGITAVWRVSSISLDEVYSIDNIPDTAMYVGVRYTY